MKRQTVMHHCVVGGIAVCFSWFAFWRIGGTIRRENAMILALCEMPKKQTANHIHSVCSDFSICCVLTHYYEEPEVNVNGHTPHTHRSFDPLPQRQQTAHKNRVCYTILIASAVDQLPFTEKFLHGSRSCDHYHTATSIRTAESKHGIQIHARTCKKVCVCACMPAYTCIDVYMH